MKWPWPSGFCQPLKMTKAPPARVARHRNKVQDHRLTYEHLSGKAMPCGNASCHGAPIEDLNEEESERQMMVTGGDIQEGGVLIANLPPARSPEVRKEVAERDTVYQGPKEAGKENRKRFDSHMANEHDVPENMNFRVAFSSGPPP